MQINNDNKSINSMYEDKDLDGMPDEIDSSFDPLAHKEIEKADEKRREDEKKQRYNLITR